MKKENKKKILYTLYTAAFIGICLAPAALMPVVKADESKENRALAETPKIKTEDGNVNFEFFSEFETYFSEHFAFRQQLVTLDGKIKADVLQTSSNEDVIVGKDGWLYYAPTADDFMNVNTLSDRGINNIHHNLALLSDYCMDNGAQFIFTVAPNKNSVYPEFMPGNYIETSQNGNLEKLEAVQSECEERFWRLMTSSLLEDTYELDTLDHYTYCDLKAALISAKESAKTELYHKTDSHWNNLGALAAREALIETCGVKYSPLSNITWEPVYNWSGDLAEMIYPADVPEDLQFSTNYTYTYQYQGRFRGLDDINIKTACADKEGNLLMYRDSFGEAILPFMAESFATAEFTRAVPYNTASIAAGTTDTVVLEIVERNLGNLQKYAPVMPAPVYEGELAAAETGSDIILKIEQSGTYAHVYGELGDSFFEGNSARIFVTVGGVNYEAFNCFEDKLLGREGETSDNGFSLYIPSENGIVPSIDEVTVTVVSGSGKTVKSAK